MEFVTTDNDAWFVLTDMHFFHSLANRYDYFGENKAIVDRIGKMVLNYKDEGYKTHAIIGGDLAHRGSANDQLNDYAVQLIKYLLSFFDEKYLNMGNHEFSYFKNNPVFKFIKEIQDDRILKKYPHVRGTSLVEEIKVVPSLEFKDFEIIFCPYGFFPIRGDRETSLLIMHDKLLSDSMHTKLGTLAKGYKVMRTVIPEDAFDYIFCGDQHMAYEQWYLGKTKVYNLSTLGRTNVNEIDDSFRERIIPVILSENGNFKEVVDEPIVLHKRSAIVDESKLDVSREKYQGTKDRKEMRESLGISRTKNPIEALLEDIEISGNQVLKRMMDDILAGRLVEYNRPGG